MKNAKYSRSTCLACEGSGNVTRVSGAWLRARRKSAGVSLREFARRIGFSAAYVSDIERGQRMCTALIEAQYEKLDKVLPVPK